MPLPADAEEIQSAFAAMRPQVEAPQGAQACGAADPACNGNVRLPCQRHRQAETAAQRQSRRFDPGAGVQRTWGDGGVPAVDPAGQAESAVRGGAGGRRLDRSGYGRGWRGREPRLCAPARERRASCATATRRSRAAAANTCCCSTTTRRCCRARSTGWWRRSMPIRRGRGRAEDHLPERPAAGGRLLRPAERRERHGRAVRRPGRGRLLPSTATSPTARAPR